MITAKFKNKDQEKRNNDAKEKSERQKHFYR